jgi:16S rRNA (cytosine1402-N4)-methyltransferase
MGATENKKPKLHIPVMYTEVLSSLNLKPGKIIIDATMGTGGHSAGILEKIMPGGMLIGLDRDQESLAVAKVRLREYGEAVKFVHGNFVDISRITNELGIDTVDGILFDLGISSYQLEDPHRGFSFQHEGPLDMRMDRDSYISAYDLVNSLKEEEISTLLKNFGQERWHNRIAHLLVEERQRQPIATTQQLANIVVRAIPYKYRYRHQRIHPATRTFQAVRIAVNRELENIEQAINKSLELLNKDGVLCIISFHSLEDRIVKFAFRSAATEGRIAVMTRKPLIPTEEEVGRNNASRSAKLRVAQKL